MDTVTATLYVCANVRADAQCVPEGTDPSQALLSRRPGTIQRRTSYQRILRFFSLGKIWPVSTMLRAHLCLMCLSMMAALEKVKRFDGKECCIGAVCTCPLWHWPRSYFWHLHRHWHATDLALASAVVMRLGSVSFFQRFSPRWAKTWDSNNSSFDVSTPLEPSWWPRKITFVEGSVEVLNILCKLKDVTRMLVSPSRDRRYFQDLSMWLTLHLSAGPRIAGSENLLPWQNARDELEVEGAEKEDEGKDASQDVEVKPSHITAVGPSEAVNAAVLESWCSHFTTKAVVESPSKGEFRDKGMDCHQPIAMPRKLARTTHSTETQTLADDLIKMVPLDDCTDRHATLENAKLKPRSSSVTHRTKGTWTDHVHESHRQAAAMTVALKKTKERPGGHGGNRLAKVVQGPRKTQPRVGQLCSKFENLTMKSRPLEPECLRRGEAELSKPTPMMTKRTCGVKRITDTPAVGREHGGQDVAIDPWTKFGARRRTTSTCHSSSSSHIPRGSHLCEDLPLELRQGPTAVHVARKTVVQPRGFGHDEGAQGWTPDRHRPLPAATHRSKEEGGKGPLSGSLDLVPRPRPARSSRPLDNVRKQLSSSGTTRHDDLRENLKVLQEKRKKAKKQLRG